MNICFISDSYPGLPGAGGVSYYVRTAARSLSARGHQVHVLIGQHKNNRDFEDGAVRIHIRPVRWLPLVARFLPGLGESACLAYALRQLHRQFHLDIIEAPTWNGLAMVPALARTVPLVARYYTLTIENIMIEKRTPTLSEKFQIWAEKASGQLARATVTHSEAHRSMVMQTYGFDSIEIIPLGIDLPQVAPTVTPPLPVVLTVGFLNARKGINTFLDAAVRVLAQFPNAEFWIVGGDRGRHYEKEFRDRHSAVSDQHVRFLGYATEEQLATYYATCAVYASASVYESFGLTFVEAMARTKPVVGCDISAMKETIQHGTTGFLVPPNDSAAFAAAIVRLLQDPELQKKMGLAGHHRAVAQYSAERMAQRLESFYQKVLGAKPS